MRATRSNSMMRHTVIRKVEFVDQEFRIITYIFEWIAVPGRAADRRVCGAAGEGESKDIEDERSSTSVRSIPAASATLVAYTVTFRQPTSDRKGRPTSTSPSTRTSLRGGVVHNWPVASGGMGAVSGRPQRWGRRRCRHTLEWMTNQSPVPPPPVWRRGTYHHRWSNRAA